MTEIADRYSVARSTAQRAVSLLGDEGLIIRSAAAWIVCPPSSLRWDRNRADLRSSCSPISVRRLSDNDLSDRAVTMDP